jgi:MinD-like ATPase involved in chromosome partitioning or flagellar assembly
VLAVWGPTGAPGRTTVAVGVAAELALRGRDVILVDADCYGGAVGQHLGVLDEASGLLAAARLANAGQLDGPRLAAAAREVRPGLRVLTGLPRADRWPEVRELAFDTLVETGRRLCPYVVLDLGFSLEQSEQVFGSSAPQRNLMTVAGLDHADEVVLVGAADPVGLARLARSLVELPETVATATTRVVVNRVRPSLGWGQKEVQAMVEGFFTPASMHFLPDDPAAADRALVAGRSLVETGDSALRGALARVVDSLDEEKPTAGSGRRRPTGRFRRRRAGRAR